jgi:hypothetical protein
MPAVAMPAPAMRRRRCGRSGGRRHLGRRRSVRSRRRRADLDDLDLIRAPYDHLGPTLETLHASGRADAATPIDAGRIAWCVRQERHEEDDTERRRIAGELEDLRVGARVSVHDLAFDRDDLADPRARVGPRHDGRRGGVRKPRQEKHRRQCAQRGHRAL